MSKRIALIISIIGTAAATASPVWASEPETHDGFFLRLGLNLGPIGVTSKIEVNGQEQPGEGKFSGLTPGFDLLMGGTPLPGLVLGGALITTRTGDPTYKIGNTELTLDGSMIVAGMGVFGNFYLDPNEGLNFQGMLGYGAVDFVDSEGSSGGNDPTGPFFALGVGYDFWVGDEWSIGPFGRILMGRFSTESGSITQKASVMYPSIGAAFTYH